MATSTSKRASAAARRPGLELTPRQLARRLDPGTLPFGSTADLDPAQETIGQPRVVDAIRFGLENDSPGYNLFVTGAPGSGRMSAVRDQVEGFVRDKPAPSDWVYVHNFDNPDRPHALRLPAGRARKLAAGAESLIEAVPERLRKAFESDAYDARRREVLSGIAASRDAVLQEMQKFAQARNFALELTPMGFIYVPLREGKPMPPAEIEQAAPAERAQLEAAGEQIREEVAQGMHRLHALDREAADAMRKLDTEVALFAVDPLFLELREAYAGMPEVLAHLERVRADIPEHLSEFRQGPEGDERAALPVQPRPSSDRYRVNVLVDNGDKDTPALVFERNPTYYNVVGRVEYRAALGVLSTDFRQIKAGALHRANGGFLVMEARDLLSNPFSWEALKRALVAGEIGIENLGEQFSAVATAGLDPEPIPLDVKVVLIGDPRLYHLLYELDEDFRELFKVRVDFSPEMPWTDEGVMSYARFISRYVRTRGLRHFDAGAVARVVERGSGLREHQGRLTTRLIEITDLVTEASFIAGKAGHDLVQAADVEAAIAARERRSNLPEERLREAMLEGTLVVATEGRLVGQVNGLSVLDLGDYRFGTPTRVSARVSIGRGQLLSIEREIEMSGPIHSKGFMILQGFISGRYGQDFPLAMNATLTFEQGYGEVDGDSASSAEVYALLSALADVPVKQGIAVTGAINQNGDVQAVGGVSDKIEGFFRVCEARGLDGEQGVIIPLANQPHLGLSEAVVRAVREGRFHVWAVSNVDQGLELLTDRRAGTPGAGGRYPADSLHGLVAARLKGYAERQQAFAVPHPNGKTRH